MSGLRISESSSLAQGRSDASTLWVAGRYQLFEQLGAGGMATVTRAVDRVTGRQVALKQLRGGVAPDKRRAFEALFAREYHTLARLSHRRIVQVYEYGIADGSPYFTMELLDSQDLRELAPLPYKVACRHLRDVASSLALIHAHRLVHRDVSPRNIRLAADGSAKLIDFGALASFGLTQEIIGTPPCMAPEVLRCMPVDQRTDLYALGAVLYFVLTGRHAYPARTLRELATVWQEPPPVPSSFDASIPAALDALVMALLASDPTVRPSHAAVVIDQLTSIAGLEPEELEHAAESYLQSGRMVGREAEVQWLHKELAQASRSKGRAIVFDGPAGVGKTRLLHELCLEAQLQGAVVLKADAQETAAQFGTAASLLLNLVHGWPETAAQFNPRDRALLAQLSPELRAQLGATEPLELALDPSERRARFQMALHESCLCVASEKVLVVAVDNLQAIDDSSAALLAALASDAHERRIVLLASQRSNREVGARGAVDALRKRSSCARLRNLSAEACTELVKSLFGAAVNTGRLARLLHEQSAGNPRRCMELARLLVKRGIAKYVGGSWVLPLEIAADELPSELDDLLAARIAGLSGSALALSEAMSVYARPVSLEHALALAEGDGSSQTTAHAALDELLDEEVLCLEGARFRFVETDLREAVAVQIQPQRRRTLHKRAAELMLSRADEQLSQPIDAAWHLLLAGEERRGASLVIASVKAYLQAALRPDSFEQVVEALLAALTVYDGQPQRTPHELAEILFPLMSFGFMVDWRIADAHGLRAVEVGLDVTGLQLAARLRPRLGPKLALGIGLGRAWFRFLGHRSGEHRYNLIKAIEAFCAIVPPTIASWTMRYDHVGAARLIELLEPLRLFGARHVTTLMHDYGVAQLRMVQGRVVEARELLAAIQPRFEDPAVARLLGDTHLRLLKGGVLFAIGILAPIEAGNSEREIAAQLEQLDVPLWSMGAAQVRVLHHALRGEIHAVEQHLERVEVFAVQGGTTWQADMFWPFLLLQCYLETEDRIGARRCVEQLVRRAQDAASLKVFAEIGRAAYLALRGELAAAIAAFEQHTEHFTSATGVAWTVLRMWYAEALIAAGQSARAKAWLIDTLAILGPEHRYVRREQIQGRRLLALAEASLGNHAEATRGIDTLLAEHGALDQPLIVGLLHRTRAELALAANDRPSFERHAAEMEQRFSASRNPALIAQWERLTSRAVLAKPNWSTETRLVGRHVEQSVLSQLTLANDRYDCALRLILQRSRAKSAYLYWKLDGELRLVASSCAIDPGEELEALLRRRVARAENTLRMRSEAEPSQEGTVLERSARRLAGGSASQRPAANKARATAPQEPEPETEATEVLTSVHQVLPLHLRRDTRILGGVILEMPLLDSEGFDARFLELVSASLAELTTGHASLPLAEE